MLQSFALTPETANVPLLMCHGDADPVVQFKWGQLSKQKLQAAGVKDIQFNVYPNMQHSACMQELDDIKDWLHRVLPRV